MIKLLDIRETFNDYKKSTLYLCGSICTLNCPDCFHSHLKKEHPTTLSKEQLLEKYIIPTSAEAILFSGLNWFEQSEELYSLIKFIRDNHIQKDIVIYTGFEKSVITQEIEKLKQFPNIIIKYGRYNENLPKRYDEVLGITLASSNQNAEKIS